MTPSFNHFNNNEIKVLCNAFDALERESHPVLDGAEPHTTLVRQLCEEVRLRDAIRRGTVYNPSNPST